MPTDSFSRMESNESMNDSHVQEKLSTSPADSSFILPSMDGSPPKVVTMEEVQDVFKNIKNMTLAHEIALNPEFKLEPYVPPPGSLEIRIKDMVHKAFWDILREDLQKKPPCYDSAINLLAQIKECFPQILTINNKRALDYINEVLDEAVIKQQAERGLLDFDSYANFVIQIMAKSCAPARDEAIKKLSETDDVVDTFRGILETMSLMKLDMANYLLDNARKDILSNTVEYEKEKFKGLLEYYKFGFPATEDWLKRNRKFDENQKPCSNSDTILNAYMELIDWPANSEFPEVLSLDKGRILLLGGRAQKLCLRASLMSIAQVLPIISQRADNRNKLAQEIEVLLQDFENDEESIANSMLGIYEHMRNFINDALRKEESSPMNETVEDHFKQQVLQISKKNSPVRALMWKRLMTYLRMNLRTFNPDLSPELPGYNDCMDKVGAFVVAFKRVISYNHSVFGDYFLQILNKETTVASNNDSNAAATTSSNSSSQSLNNDKIEAATASTSSVAANKCI